ARPARRAARLPGPGSWHLVAVAEAVRASRELGGVAGEDELHRRAGVAARVVAERGHEALAAAYSEKHIRVRGSRDRKRLDRSSPQQASDRPGAVAQPGCVADGDG